VRTSASALPNANPDAPATLSDSAKVVGWGLVFWGGVQMAAVTFERNSLAMVAVQAGLAEWGGARMGIAWSPPPEGSGARGASAWRGPARRAAIGGALGLAFAAIVVAIGSLVGASTSFSGVPAPSALAIGLLVAVFVAVRDEILLRGVVVRATRLLPAAGTLAACGLAAAAARLGSDGRFTAALVPEALRGVALGAIWMRDRGAWMACAANAASAWSTGALGGGLGDAGPSVDGVVATCVLAVAAIAASAWATRGPRVARGTP
jgi:hypothetical protein